MAGRLGRILGGLVALGFPSACLVCRNPLEWPLEGPICHACWRSMPVIGPAYCPRCGLPYQETVSPGLCGPCRVEKTRHFRLARAAGPYRGALKKSLLHLKYRGRSRLAAALGRMAFEKCVASGPLDAGAAVVPVPLHWRRRRARGYNQAELVAKAVAREAQRPLSRVLKKVRHRPPQAGLSAGGRRRNAAGAYRVRLPQDLTGKRLLLVDDVFTTGATAEACARALLQAGAEAVDVLTVARVP